MRYAFVSIGLALLGGCVVTGGRGEDTPPPTPRDGGAPSEQTVCPDPSGLPNPVATITTSLGIIKVELLEDAAPNTVASFVSLAEAGFYDGHIFHRVIPRFMIQGGSPEGHPAGGPGYTFADEIDAVALGLDSILLADREDIRDTAGTRGAAALSRYIANQLGVLTVEEYRARRPEVMALESKVSIQEFYEAIGYTYTACLPSISLDRGVLAMANAGPDTNGSQFFITHVDTGLALDGKHTGFGVVIEGMDVVDAIGAVERDEKNRPTTDVVIESVVVEGLRDHEYVPVSVPRPFPS